MRPVSRKLSKFLALENIVIDVGHDAGKRDVPLPKSSYRGTEALGSDNQASYAGKGKVDVHGPKPVLAER